MTLAAVIALVWTGLAAAAVLGYLFGVGVGVRRGWEEGYQQGIADAAEDVVRLSRPRTPSQHAG
jgi:hypothetical protein